MSKIMFKTLQWNHWPVACGSTWVLNILMSLLRVQTMENCGSFVNSNPELSLPCLSYSWSQLYNKKPVYSNRQIPVFSCQLMVQFKSGTRLPSEEKSKYQGKECQKIIEQSEVNLMGDWDEGKGGTPSPPQCLGPFPCLNPSLYLPFCPLLRSVVPV